MDVILIDDDRDVVPLVATALRAAGHDVRTCVTAREGLAAVSTRSPQVVITDLLLAGGVSGCELARKLRAEPATAHIGLIAVTRSVEPEWSIVRSFDAYLRKPFDVNLLAHLVAALAPRALERPLAER